MYLLAALHFLPDVLGSFPAQKKKKKKSRRLPLCATSVRSQAIWNINEQTLCSTSNVDCKGVSDWRDQTSPLWCHKGNSCLNDTPQRNDNHGQPHRPLWPQSVAPVVARGKRFYLETASRGRNRLLYWASVLMMLLFSWQLLHCDFDLVRLYKNNITFSSSSRQEVHLQQFSSSSNNDGFISTILCTVVVSSMCSRETEVQQPISTATQHWLTFVRGNAG